MGWSLGLNEKGKKEAEYLCSSSWLGIQCGQPPHSAPMSILLTEDTMRPASTPSIHLLPPDWGYNLASLLTECPCSPSWLGDTMWPASSPSIHVLSWGIQCGQPSYWGSMLSLLTEDMPSAASCSHCHVFPNKIWPKTVTQTTGSFLPVLLLLGILS